MEILFEIISFRQKGVARTRNQENIEPPSSTRFGAIGKIRTGNKNWGVGNEIFEKMELILPLS